MPRKFEFGIHRFDLGEQNEANRWGDVELLSCLNAFGAAGWDAVTIRTAGDKCWVLLRREVEQHSGGDIPADAPHPVPIGGYFVR